MSLGRVSLVAGLASVGVAGALASASAFLLSSANSAKISEALISPASIAFNNPSLSTNSLAAFLAASLSAIFGSFAIASSN